MNIREAADMADVVRATHIKVQELLNKEMEHWPTCINPDTRQADFERYMVGLESLKDKEAYYYKVVSKCLHTLMWIKVPEDKNDRT